MKPHPPGAAGALACGILSLCCAWLPPAGVSFAIVALIVAQRADRRALASPDAFAPTALIPAGRVCALVGLGLSLLVVLCWLVFGAILAAMVGGAPPPPAEPPITF